MKRNDIEQEISNTIEQENTNSYEKELRFRFSTSLNREFKKVHFFRRKYLENRERKFNKFRQ